MNQWRACGAIAIAVATMTFALSTSAAQTFRFVTTSDAQGNSESNPNPGNSFGYVVSRISALNPVPDFWIFGGDAYYSATDSANAAANWDTFKMKIDPISDIPIYLAIGNHDANNYGNFYGPWHGDGAGPFRASWQGLPQNGPAGYAGTAYSFRYANSLFCVVNTNIYDAATYAATFKVDATQRSWLSAVLDTTTAAHTFVIGHCEAYPPSDGNDNSSLQWNASDRNAFWDVLTGHGVEAYICGHIHLWNDDFFAASGYGNAPANTSTRQVVCGGAGGGLVSGYGGNFYHFVVWDIDGPSVVARVIDSYGNQRDSFAYVTGVAGGPAADPHPAPVARIRYYGSRIHWDGTAAGSVSVYDIAGRLVARMDAAGSSVAWDPGAVRNGVFLVRFEPAAGGRPVTGRMVVVR